MIFHLNCTIIYILNYIYLFQIQSRSLQSNQLYMDNQYVTDLYAEVIGILAQSRFMLVKRRFLLEFDRLKLNISPISTSTNSQSATVINPVASAVAGSTSNYNLPSTNAATAQLTSNSVPSNLQSANLSLNSNNNSNLITQTQPLANQTLQQLISPSNTIEYQHNKALDGHEIFSYQNGANRRF
jgi:hypothetical protein